MNGPLDSVHLLNAGSLMPCQPIPVISTAGQVQGYYVVPQNLSRLTPMADGAVASQFASATPVSVSLLPNAGINRPRLLPRLLSIPTSAANKYIAPAQTATKQQSCAGGTASNNVTSPPITTSHVAPTALPDAASRLAQPGRLDAQQLSGQTSKPETTVAPTVLPDAASPLAQPGRLDAQQLFGQTSEPDTNVAPTALPDAASRLAQPGRLDAQQLSGQTSKPDTIYVDRPAPGNVTPVSVYEQELKQLIDQTKRQVNYLVTNATESLKAIKKLTVAPLGAIDEAKQSLKTTINEERQKINITYQALEEINKQLVPIALSTTALNQNLMQELRTHMHKLAEEHHSHLVHLLERRPPPLRECVSPTPQAADTAETTETDSELTLFLFDRQLGTFQSDMQHLLRLNTAIDQWFGIQNSGKPGSIRMMLQHAADILDGNIARNSCLPQETSSRPGSRKRKRIYRKPAADTTSNYQTLKQLTQALTVKGRAQTPAPRSLYELIEATADAIELLHLSTKKRDRQPETQQPSYTHDHNYLRVEPDHG